MFRSVLVDILESLVGQKEVAEVEYERAIKVALDAGLPEIAVVLKQIRTEMSKHRDALELILIGVKDGE